MENTAGDEPESILSYNWIQTRSKSEFPAFSDGNPILGTLFKKLFILFRSRI